MLVPGVPPTCIMMVWTLLCVGVCVRWALPSFSISASTLCLESFQGRGSPSSPCGVCETRVSDGSGRGHPQHRLESLEPKWRCAFALRGGLVTLWDSALYQELGGFRLSKRRVFERVICECRDPLLTLGAPRKQTTALLRLGFGCPWSSGLSRGSDQN